MFKGKILTLDSHFIRFILVGILNTMVGYGLFALFIYLGLHYSLAVLFSTILGVLFNFKSIGRLVFNTSDNERIYHFIGVYMLLYLLNVSGLWGLSSIGIENMYVAGAILLVPLAIISFVLNKNFVFNQEVDFEKN
jgi:putative flippase GtrA